MSEHEDSSKRQDTAQARKALNEECTSIGVMG